MLLEHTLKTAEATQYGYATEYGSVTEFNSADILDIMKQKFLSKNAPIATMEGLLNQVQSAYRMSRTQIEAMFTTGWAEGAQLALTMADDLEAVLPMPKDLRRALHYSDHGDELMIDNLYSGRFDNLFRTRKRKYRPTQTVVTVGMHLCTLWSSPKETMLSGAVGIALARVLERYGYRVELLSLLTANEYRYKKGQQNVYRGGRSIQHVGVVNVKQAFATLNAAEIAAVHHPATAHTLVKGVMGRGRAQIGAGCACNDSASDFAQHFMEHTGRRLDYCFDWIGSERSAKRELIQAVKSMGGTIFNQEDVDAL